MDNVTQADGRPAIVVYECLSGVVFHITPMNIATARAIQLKAQALNPYPDPKPFQKPDENAFVEGQLSPPEENPEYLEACKAVDFKRGQWVDKAIFKYAAKMPKYPTEQSVIEAFKPQLEQLKEIADFGDDTDYDIVMLNCVLTGNTGGVSDYVRIIRIAIQSVALEAEEISNGIRFFRTRV